MRCSRTIKRSARLAVGLAVVGTVLGAGRDSAPSRDVDPSEIVIIVPEPALAIPNAMGLNDQKLTQWDAARRLQMLLRRATGIEPPAVSATNMPTSGMLCFVGFGSHLDGKAVSPTRPEGIKIQVDGRNLFLLGEIAATGINSNPAPLDRGVMHAVETFAEEVLGYRFLFSTPEDEAMFELGTVIPRLHKIRLASGLLIDDAPVFPHRTSSLSPRNQMGHRSGSTPAFFCNHSYGMPWWSESFGQSHPEMFIPQKPNKNIQADQAAKVMATQADLSFLDFTEPRVLESRLEQYTRFYQDGKAGGFYFNPTLHYLVEEPPDWMAETVQYNERSSALFDPNHHPWGNFSNIWFDYLNRLAQQMRLLWPGRRVATLAYMRHYGVPTLPVDDDIDIMVTMMRTSMGNKEPEVFEKNLADVRKWSECLQGNRTRLFLWEYECWPAMWTSVPILCPNAMKRWLQIVRPYVSGVFLESHGPNEYYFIMNRLWMRLLWNPDLDVAAELDDICRRFFGPAGETMRKFHSQLIERYETPWKDPRLTWDQYYLDDNLYFRQSYPPEEVEELALLLEQAKREVGLPPVVTKEVANGSAIFLANISKAPCSVSIIIRAKNDPVVNPSVVWDNGSLSWSGSLGPDEWLEVSDLVATVFSADGERRSVVLVRTGSTPQLQPQGSMCFGFQQARNRPEAHFEVTLRFGPDDTKSPSPLNANLFAKRLDWLSDAYQVLPPFHVWRNDPQHPGERLPTRGFFADAHRRQMKMGLRPTWPTVNATDAICTPDDHRAADALVGSARTALAEADKMTEEARRREVAIARKAFVSALARCPDWKIDEVPKDDVWGTIAARKERADIWEQLGNGRRMRAEYEEALSTIPKQQADAISYLYMLMGDAFAKMGDWVEAESCYLKAKKSGLYGDRKIQIPQKLETVRRLTQAKRQDVTTP